MSILGFSSCPKSSTRIFIVKRISHTKSLGKILFLSWDTEDIAKPSFEKIPDEVKHLFTHS
jgi:hypothetical protein